MPQVGKRIVISFHFLSIFWKALHKDKSLPEIREKRREITKKPALLLEGLYSQNFFEFNFISSFAEISFLK